MKKLSAKEKRIVKLLNIEDGRKILAKEISQIIDKALCYHMNEAMKIEIKFDEVLKKHKGKTLFCEKVIEKIGDSVIQSDVYHASEKDIKSAIELYNKGNCQHNIIYDETGYMYDIRYCAICDEFLGVI